MDATKTGGLVVWESRVLMICGLFKSLWFWRYTGLGVYGGLEVHGSRGLEYLSYVVLEGGLYQVFEIAGEPGGLKRVSPGVKSSEVLPEKLVQTCLVLTYHKKHCAGLKSRWSGHFLPEATQGTA